jgi:ketosteroid isomerase-like protein
MKQKKMITLPMILLLVVSFHIYAGDTSAEISEIKTCVDKWVKMWNTYDLLEVKRLFLNSNKLTYFSSEKQGIIKGIDEVIKHHKGFGFVNGGKSQQNKLWLEDLTITPLGKSVIVTGIWFFKKPGKLQKGPVTIVYLKQDNQFKIAHMHFANY